LFLDVTGIGVLFGGEEELGREVVAELKRLGYEVRVAVADTIGAGWALVKQTSSPDVQVLSTEYLVLSIEFPPDQSIGDSPRPFRTLPMDSLRLPAETVDLLSQLGVERLEQVLVLPRESLKARFGELLLLRIDQLIGTAQEMIVPYRPPPQFSEEWLLEYPAEGRELVEQILRELVRRVATALACRREGVLKLGCRLDCAPGRPVRLDVGLFRPSADQEHLWDLLKMQLEQAALPGPVGRVRLEAALTAALENRQGELFAGGEQEAQRQLALFIDRCSSRLGPEAVLRPELTADPLPERGVRYRAGVGSRGSGVRSRRSVVRSQRSEYAVLSTQYSVLSRRRRKADSISSESAIRNSQSALIRPLVLHSPPWPLEVLSVAPDGPPVSFRLQGKTHEVVGSAGPERIETGWWRGRSVRRDYWRVETAGGQRFWLFRKIGTSQWYLHGEYA
jgi:protein ImuB